METKKNKQTKDLVKEITEKEIRDNMQSEVREGFETILNNIKTLRDLILGNLETILGRVG
jgi:hypothetical protein